MGEGRGIYSVAMFQLVASAISLATSFFILFQNLSRAHSVAPRFQIEPASLGFDLVLGANPKADSIYNCCDVSARCKRCIACSGFFIFKIAWRLKEESTHV